MPARVVIALLISALLFGAAAWDRALYRQRQELSLSVLQQVIEEQPRSIVPGSVLLTGWVYGELEGGVVPRTATGDLGEADPARPRLKFFVPTWWRDRLAIERSMKEGGIPFLTGSLGLRFYYRAYFAGGIFALLLGLGLWLDERLTRGRLEDTRAGDRGWLRAWSLWMAMSLALASCGVAAGFHFAPVTQWNWLYALPAIWGPLLLGAAGLLGCLLAGALRLGVRWNRRPARGKRRIA